LEHLSHVLAAHIRDRKHNQEALNKKLVEVENKSERCIDIQKKEIKETCSYFAKQME